MMGRGGAYVAITDRLEDRGACVPVEEGAEAQVNRARYGPALQHRRGERAAGHTLTQLVDS